MDIVKHECPESECCYFGKPSPSSCACHRDEKQMMADEIVRQSADIAWQAKLLDRVRNKILCINDKIEDEGDRVYFGSTNHADDFRDIAKRVELWDYDRIMAQGSKRDLYSEMVGLRATIESLTAERDALREALEACRSQFQFYADEHASAGKAEKAATNQRFADSAAAALSPEPRP